MVLHLMYDKAYTRAYLVCLASVQSSYKSTFRCPLPYISMLPYFHVVWLFRY